MEKQIVVFVKDLQNELAVPLTALNLKCFSDGTLVSLVQMDSHTTVFRFGTATKLSGSAIDVGLKVEVSYSH